jgi:hypothetical protein
MAIVFIESSKNVENFPRGRGARAARVFFIFFELAPLKAGRP